MSIDEQTKKPEGMIRGFYWMSQAWYAPHLRLAGFVDEVSFGFFHPTEGSTTAELMMRWYDINSDTCPRLEVFDTAWGALYQFQDALKALAERESQRITPAQFCELLKSLGFTDLTKRER